MPYTFSFDASFLTTAGYLDRASFERGSYPGLDYSDQYAAVAPDQRIATSGGVDVVAVTLVAGDRYYLDIDNAAIDLEIDVIDQRGNRAVRGDDYNGDEDPFLSFTVETTGTYFVAVHHAANDYIDGTFSFEGTRAPTGDYQLAISTPSVPGRRFTLTNDDESRGYSDNSNVVRARGGNDVISLNGGDDIALGGSGSDRIYGGDGRDELAGGTGGDRLRGGSGNDVVRGDDGRDRLYGDDGEDGLRGGAGNDYVSGDAGNDVLWGQAGDDELRGGSGSDFLRGGVGIDQLYGGRGADTFHFLRGESPASDTSNEDRIQDFASNDRIDLSDLLLGSLTWRGGSSFTAANQVRVVELTNGYTDVRVNLDSDRSSEFEVLVDTTGFDLGRSDFLL